MDSPKKVANFLYCSSILEEKTYHMYYELSKKIEDPTIKSMILTIAHDSFRHSTQIREISEDIIDKLPKEKECKKGLKDALTNNETLRKEITKTATFDSKSLVELAEKLAIFEYSLSEEYSTLVELQTLQFMSYKVYISYGIDMEYAKGVFESIIEDEKRHRELLFKIINFLSQHGEDKNPKFKYQRPDAWYPPPRQ
jgi:rubrerythrin